MFKAISQGIKSSAAAAIKSNLGQTIQNTIDSHKVISIRQGKFIDPGRSVETSNAETKTTISLNKVDTNTTPSPTPSKKPTIDRTAFNNWQRRSKPIGNIAIEIHGLHEGNEDTIDQHDKRKEQGGDRIRQGTKFYALILLEGQRHTTGKLQDLDQQQDDILDTILNNIDEKEDNKDPNDDTATTTTKDFNLSNNDVLGELSCNLDVRNVTSDVFIQIWSTRTTIVDSVPGDDENDGLRKSHLFHGQCVVPLRHLCAQSSTSTIESNELQHTLLHLWPLSSNDSKLQSGIARLAGSAMTKPAFTLRGQKSTRKENVTYPSTVEVSISFKFKKFMNLSKALVCNPPYPIVNAIDDPRCKHLIDVYYLKKGIIRTKAVFQKKFVIFEALKSLRNWDNPIVSLLFLGVVLSTWWYVSNPIFVPFLIAMVFSLCSFTTYVLNFKKWKRKTKKNKNKKNNQEKQDNNENKENNENEADNDDDDDDDDDDACDQNGFPTKAMGQMGGGKKQIVWEEQVGSDPDNTIAKMKMVHGLLASAAHPLNKYSSRIERAINAFSGEDPWITLLLNGVVLSGGLVLTGMVWVMSLIGWNNVVVLLILIGMTPPLMLKNITNVEKKDGGEKGTTTMIERLAWLYAKVPDIDETIHRKMATRQIKQVE